jgi:hypothetical protein
MITPEVVNFIKGQDAKGTSREATRLLLMSQGGWSTENIDEAFAAVPTIYAAATPETPKPPAQTVVADPEPEKTHPIVSALGAVFVALLICGIGAAAIYFLVPGIREDIAFISGTLNGQ